ncbi:hypothetical protein CRUP_014796 [Coryphaenoides rupestris]|nr:hypothetical protein CRUP_014796 [Coryphaenoides rupestris]
MEHFRSVLNIVTQQTTLGYGLIALVTAGGERIFSTAVFRSAAPRWSPLQLGYGGAAARGFFECAMTGFNFTFLQNATCVAAARLSIKDLPQTDVDNVLAKHTRRVADPTRNTTYQPPMHRPGSMLECTPTTPDHTDEPDANASAHSFGIGQVRVVPNRWPVI